MLCYFFQAPCFSKAAYRKLLGSLTGKSGLRKAAATTFINMFFGMMQQHDREDVMQTMLDSIIIYEHVSV